MTLLEHAEWLVAEKGSKEAGSLLSKAREILAELDARPMLERLALSAKTEANSA